MKTSCPKCGKAMYAKGVQTECFPCRKVEHQRQHRMKYVRKGYKFVGREIHPEPYPKIVIDPWCQRVE